jgi:hypothetical protein
MQQRKPTVSMPARPAGIGQKLSLNTEGKRRLNVLRADVQAMITTGQSCHELIASDVEAKHVKFSAAGNGVNFLDGLKVPAKRSELLSEVCIAMAPGQPFLTSEASFKSFLRPTNLAQSCVFQSITFALFLYRRSMPAL